MVDTRNTRMQLRDALEVSDAVIRSRPRRVVDLAAALARDGEANGFAEPILAMCDAVLIVARKKAIAAARYKGDSPEGGDLEKQANNLLGIYEQLSAAFDVAVTNGG